MKTELTILLVIVFSITVLLIIVHVLKHREKYSSGSSSDPNNKGDTLHVRDFLLPGEYLQSKADSQNNYTARLGGKYNKLVLSNGRNTDYDSIAQKGELYPKFWDAETKKLNKNISIKLKQIVEAFVADFKYTLIIKDIILTGSMANYNWNRYSDIDLHILVDFSEIPDEYMEAFRDYFVAKQQIWNKTHNISILGHEVEVYIQDTNELDYSTGLYSVMNDKWNTEPTFTKQDIKYEEVSKKTEYFIDQINKVSELFAKKDFQKAKTGADNIRQEIKKYRQVGLDNQGEYSTENLVFKMLRNGGYLETLSNLKIQSADNQMGIEEEIFAFQEPIEEGKKMLAKAKYKVWPSAYASGYL